MCNYVYNIPFIQLGVTGAASLAAMISTDSHWHSPSDRPPEVRSHLFKKRETDLDSYGILMG